jgi:hypothetical protein
VFAVLGAQDTKNVQVVFFFFPSFPLSTRFFFFFFPLLFFSFARRVLSVGETVARGDTQEMKLLAKQRAARRSMST